MSGLVLYLTGLKEIDREKDLVDNAKGMNTGGSVVLKGGWDSTFKTCYIRIIGHKTP